MRTRSRRELEQHLKAESYRARVPVSVTFELTHACNLRCLHCLNPTHVASGELGTDEVVAVLRQLCELGTLDVNLTGGEVFARRDLAQILAACRELGLKVTLLTNATRVDAAAMKLLQAQPPDRINVSLYGATAASYEAVTGVPGSFELFLAGFARLRRTGVPLELVAVVLEENRHEVDAMRDLSQRLGVHFKYAVDVHARQDGLKDPLSHRIPPAAVIDLAERFAGFVPGVTPQPPPLRGPFYCGCGRSSASITPHGIMNFCVSVPIGQQNVRGGNVARAWRSLVEQRDGYDREPSDCSSCELLRYCSRSAHDSLLEAGDVGRCVPYYYDLAALVRERYDTAGR